MTKLAYGVPVPRGMRRDWEPSSMILDGCADLMRRYGVNAAWGEPERVVSWANLDGDIKAIVAAYPDNRLASIRFGARNWTLTLGKQEPRP